jgi:hypothetical protein
MEEIEIRKIIEKNVFERLEQQCLDMSGTSHFWSRSRREKVVGLGPGPGGKIF